MRGHLAAQIDPLGLNNMDSEKARNMIIRSVKVDEKDLDKEFQLPQTTWIGGDQKTLPLREIIRRMENVYCKSIGAEYMHINNLDQINWIRQRLESPGAMELNNTEKRLLLARHVASFAAAKSSHNNVIFPGSVEVLALKGSLPRSGRVRRDLALKELTCSSLA